MHCNGTLSESCDAIFSTFRKSVELKCDMTNNENKLLPCKTYETCLRMLGKYQTTETVDFLRTNRSLNNVQDFSQLKAFEAHDIEKQNK